MFNRLFIGIILCIILGCNTSKKTAGYIWPHHNKSETNLNDIHIEEWETAYHIKFGESFFRFGDLAVQDIFQKAFLSGFLKNGAKNIDDTVITSSPYLYMKNLLKVFPFSDKLIDVSIKAVPSGEGWGNFPPHYHFYYLVPKYEGDSIAFRKIDIERTVANAVLYGSTAYYEKKLFFFGEPNDSLMLENSKKSISISGQHYQPGGFLIGIAGPIDEGMYPGTVHPENRFFILNSHVFNYERNIQLLFFHYFFSVDCLSRSSNVYSPFEFNNYLDRVVKIQTKIKSTPFLTILPKDRWTENLKNFIHIAMSAEYGCKKSPELIGINKKTIYRFSFYSEVKGKKMEVLFDVNQIRILEVKEME